VPHVVISYGKDDGAQKTILPQLCRHLKGLQEDGVLTFFADFALEPGDDWEKRLVEGFDKGQAAVGRFGPAFQSSKFIREVELPLLQRRQKAKKILLYLLPLVDFNYKSIPGFKEIQFAVEPSKPLKALTPGRRDTIFKNVLGHIIQN